MRIKMEERATKSINRELIGGYRKRKVSLWNLQDSPVTISQDPEWSGGSRTYCTFWRLNGSSYTLLHRSEAGITTTRKREDGSPLMSLAGPYEETTLYSEVLCVETGYFCGKTATMRIIGNDHSLRAVNRD